MIMLAMTSGEGEIYSPQDLLGYIMRPGLKKHTPQIKSHKIPSVPILLKIFNN